MKIHLLSDLHLEFDSFQPSHVAADVVVLAGDVHLKQRGVAWAMLQFPATTPVLYVAGNHEYYGATWPTLLEKLATQAMHSQVHVLEHRQFSVSGVNFFGCTLWTDFELFGDPRIAGFHCQQCMNDFRKIRKAPSYSKLRSLDAAIIHRHSLTWLAQQLEAHQGEINVVISHHGPSPLSLPDMYRTDMTSAAYVSQLQDFILRYQPSLWLHGHLHNSSDYYIGRCRVVCNPRGYPTERNPDFDPSLLVEI